MALFDTTAFRIAEQGINILSQQQSVIAQNIANADTPDYDCKYLYFEEVLRDKVGVSEDAKYKKELNLATALYTDTVTNDQPDGNNVDSDTQNALLAKNAIMYEALINQMNSEFNMMRTAMSRT